MATEVPWVRDLEAEQSMPFQVVWTAQVSGHSLVLLGDMVSPAGLQWLSQIDGRLASDGRTTRNSAREAAERRLGELLELEARDG
jgi:hypothetical protein